MLKSLMKRAVKMNYIFLALFIVFNSQILSQNNNDQTESWETTKQGGVCFRVTGNHPMNDYLTYSTMFKQRNKNFSFTIGLGEQEVGTDGYAAGILQMQQEGNELLDPTPNFRTNYFRTIFDPLSYNGLPGVDHIIGNKICLEFDDLDLSKKVQEGYLDIYNNKVYGEHEFSNFGNGNVYVYFPSLVTLVLIDMVNPIDNDVFMIYDVWNDPIDLGIHLNIKYYLFSAIDIPVKDESMVLLGFESMKLADYYGIQRSYSWIQPGGSYPLMSSEKVKNTMGNQLGYMSGEVYSSITSFMTYNEYDPLGDRRYAMLWGNFREDEWTIEESKAVIADFVAKNRVAISHSYLGTRPGDSSDYL